MAESAKPTRLTAAQCREHASVCQRMATVATRPEHRIMLEKMAETWSRTATDVEGDEAKLS